jgi:SAM-dependent methyltransferase
MKIRSPFDRSDLRIKKKDKVLEIGSGHNPSFRSNVIVEKFVESNYHRCGDVNIYAHQRFINADGEKLPFKDKEFDYVICNQVLEHVDDPIAFVNEQSRVAKRGYIETPSLLGEYLFPKKSHKWVILDIDNQLVMFEKSKMPGNYQNNYGELFLNYLPYQSLVYKLLWLTEGDLMINRYEWVDSIDVIVNPDDEYYLSFFTQPWNLEMTKKLYPQRRLAKEIVKLSSALLHLIKVSVKNKLKKQRPINLLGYINKRSG